MESKERNTQLANEILMELINTYEENQIRVFLATINKVLTKHYAITRDAREEDENAIENYCTLEVEIPLSFYKEYGAKGEYSIEKWKDIVEAIMVKIRIKEEGKIKTLNLISSIEFDYETNIFYILFNQDNFEYVLLLRDRNYTVIDLEEIRKLKGKYEIGLYLAMWQFIDKGERVFSIDGCKRYFDYKGKTNKEFMRNIRKATENINRKMNYKIKIDTVVKNREIINVSVKFPKRRKKVSRQVQYGEGKEK